MITVIETITVIKVIRVGEEVNSELSTGAEDSA